VKSHKHLVEGAIYSLATTPYQYEARLIPDKPQYRAAGLVWVLLPQPLNKDNPNLLCGPVLFVDEESNIRRAEGALPITTEVLNFTGRYT